MTREEFRTGIIEVLKNPDTALVNIEPFIEAYGEQADSLEALTLKTEESDKRIRDLQDTNQRLFLRATGTEESHEEEETEKTFDQIFDGLVEKE